MLMHRVISAIELINSKRNEQIIIWGAGSGGQLVYDFCRFINLPVAFFVDKANADKDGELFGKKVLNPLTIKEAKERGQTLFVLVGSSFYEEIKDTLLNWGCIEGIDFINALSFPTNRQLKYDQSFRNYVSKLPNPIPLFRIIEIETINRCNGSCSFCVANSHLNPREFKKMSESLFDSIIYQLKELDFDGYISLYSNNEPFMDDRIIHFLSKLKQAIPKSYSFLSTNGTLITMEMFIESMKYLDAMIIDNYSDDYEFHPRIKAIYEYCKENEEISKKVLIAKRKQNEKLTTRGGSAPNREKIQVKDIICPLPFQHMAVRPDGGVSLCCNDVLGKYTLGDLNKDRIIDIWHSKEYSDIRERMIKGRQYLRLCENCDTLGGAITEKDYNPISSRKEVLRVKV